MKKQARSKKKPFQLEEATIDSLHEAIKSGRTTCIAVVQHYIERVRAFSLLDDGRQRDRVVRDCPGHDFHVGLA
jgi:hypothetical protein